MSRRLASIHQFPLDRRYGPDDAGCHADGTYSHDHVRLALAGLVLRTFPPGAAEHAEAMGLHSELLGPPPDDYADEDRALDLLNTRCDGVAFGLYEGDLVCATHEDWGV